MLAGFGALLIVIGLIGTVPIHNVLYLFIAGLFLLVRDGLANQKISNVLLALSVLSVVVLPYFDLSQYLPLSSEPAGGLLISTGLLLGAIGLRTFILARKTA